MDIALGDGATVAPANDGVPSLAAVLKDVTKAHGPMVMRKASHALTTFKHIPTGIFTLDMALHGGIPQSLITMPFGWESSGKALALDTPLPTPTGWTTMGDVAVGDEVLGADGAPCRVVFATEVQHGRECFAVQFSDGARIVADAEHLWSVQSRYATHEVAPRVASTRELAQDVSRDYGNGDVRYRWRVPVAGALDLPEAVLPLSPYALGVWLGDGHSANDRITVCDQGILDALRGDGCQLFRMTPAADRVVNHRITFDGAQTFYSGLRALGLVNNKHVPAAYLRASRAQRIALLQGLMDTDGYAPKDARSCEIVTVRPALRDGIMELVRTLGLRPSLVEDRAMLDGRDCGPRYRISFKPSGFNPFRLARKAERVDLTVTRRPRAQSRSIVSITPVPSVSVRCIQVDSADHLYLAGRDMVPTHNTTVTMRAVGNAQKKYPDKQPVFVDGEGTFDPAWARRHGVDPDQMLLVQPETGEQAVDIVDAVVRARDTSIVVVDSLPALMPVKELEKSAEDSTVALQARLIGLMARKVTQALIDQRKKGYIPAVIFINQWRSKIAMMGDTRNLPGGNALKFFIALSFEVMNKEVLGKDQFDVETVVLNEHSFKIKKNKLGNGIRTGAFDMIRDPSHPMGAGFIDDAAAVLTYAKKFGVFGGGGSSWRIDGIDRKFGKAGEAVTWLYEEPEQFAALKTRLISMQRYNCGLPAEGWY